MESEPDLAKNGRGKPPARPGCLTAVIIFVLLAAAVNFVSDCGSPGPRDRSTETARATEDASSYVARYGGSIDVYRRIMTMTDCSALQSTFDRAASNNDRTVAGSAEAKWTTGYMSAADDRMRAVGCYD